MKSFVRLFLFGMAVCMMFSGSAEEKKQEKILYLPKDQSYTEEMTGIVFLPVIEGFKKYQVAKNLNPVYGTAIRFVNEFGTCADIYLYSMDTSAKPVTEEQMIQAFESTKSGILKLPNQRNSIRQVSLLENAPRYEAFPKVRSAAFTMELGEEEVRSELIMLVFKGKLVKIRITFAADVPEETAAAKKFAEATLRLFQDTPKP